MGLIELVLFLVVIVLYFLPTFIAIGKKHFSGILLLNIFLGWTFLGWIGALIWAVCSEKKMDLQLKQSS